MVLGIIVAMRTVQTDISSKLQLLNLWIFQRYVSFELLTGLTFGFFFMVFLKYPYFNPRIFHFQSTISPVVSMPSMQVMFPSLAQVQTVACSTWNNRRICPNWRESKLECLIYCLLGIPLIYNLYIAYWVICCVFESCVWFGCFFWRLVLEWCKIFQKRTFPPGDRRMVREPSQNQVLKTNIKKHQNPPNK